MLLLLFLTHIVSASLLVNTLSFNNYGYNTTRISPKMGFSALSATQTCTRADQVSQDIMYGYVRGTKTDTNKNGVLRGLDMYKSWLNSQSNRNSFRYQSENIVGYMWVGAMVQNSGFANNIIELFKKEVNDYGFPVSGYLQYVNGDPMKSFGIIFNSDGNMANVQSAVRKWSEGKSFDSKDGSKTYNSQTVCYLSYAKRKSMGNDYEAGNCEYIRVKLGQSVVDATGVNDESLQAYNNGIDFTKLQVAQPICYSIGAPPNFKPVQNANGTCFTYTVKKGDTCSSVAAYYYPLTVNDIQIYNGWKDCNLFYNDQICLSDGVSPKCNLIKDNLLFAYKYTDNKLDSDKTKALDALKYLKQKANDLPGNRTLFYSNSNLNAYVWVGLKIDKLDNAFDNLINEVQNSGMPGYIYLEYIKYDPSKSFGIILDSRNDLNHVKSVVKQWSAGISYSDFSGKKSFSTSFCTITNEKAFNNDYSVGVCLSFTFDNKDNIPIPADSLEDYNVNLQIDSVQKGIELCKSIGTLKIPAPQGCKIYVVEDNDQDCDSIAAKFPPLTGSQIEQFNKNNALFYDCDAIWEGDKICIS